MKIAKNQNQDLRNFHNTLVGTVLQGDYFVYSHLAPTPYKGEAIQTKPTYVG